MDFRVKYVLFPTEQHKTRRRDQSFERMGIQESGSAVENLQLRPINFLWFTIFVSLPESLNHESSSLSVR